MKASTQMAKSLKTHSEWAVLMADDDEHAHVLIQRAFRKANASPLLKIVSNGEEAIHYLEGKGIYSDRNLHPLPSLVLLDLNMPKKTGFEVLQWMRGHPDFKRMVVVIFTTSDEPKDINKSYDLGANSYLVKTPLYPEFTELVKSLEVYWLKHNRRAF
ncbi:MAG: response regulator [Pedosphaera sp.]|nr:response regulator [Pedosphaera sp.]